MKNARREILVLWGTLALWWGASLYAAPAGASEVAAPEAPSVRQDGSVDVPAFNLPYSSFASAEAKDAFVAWQAVYPALANAMKSDIATLRTVMDDKYFLPMLAKQNARYRVLIEPKMVGGVYTEVFTPQAGEARRNRILVNLHGGGFVIGARTGGRVESIPIAEAARIKVVSIDYRQGPEHRFPAASEDVAVVYKQLLKHYQPKHIGVYGCSAGGLLTAQVMAWLQKEKLPMPGAIGIFCASTHNFTEGDSGQLAYRSGVIGGDPPPRVAAKLQGPYFTGASESDSLAAPSTSAVVLSRFPPTLLITGSRSSEASGAFKTQVELTLAGVDARLSVWDGMGHGFLYDPELPESREAYKVIAGFFNEHLGKHERL